MGCNLNNDNDTDSCIRYQAPSGSGGVTTEFTEYPTHVSRTGNYNILGREGIAVMYPSIEVYTGGSTYFPTSANCGKPTRPAQFDSDYVFAYDNYPTGLSFDMGVSDSYFCYLYDTSDDQGIIGRPCYHIEDEISTTSNNDGSPGGGTAGSSECTPCSGFTCTPASTTLTYTTGKNGLEPALGDDPECPHPNVWGIGTSSNKLMFSYDSLSTTQPDGVSDFSLSYDGVTYTDVWQEDQAVSTPYTTTQNPPYQSGDETFDDFQIYDLNSGTQTGFRIKVRIKAVYDDSGASTVFSGTSWEVLEILSPGANYNVNTVFPLTYTHTLPDNSTATLTVNLKVTAVAPQPSVAGQTNFDVLLIGDTLNGHTIKYVWHSDLDNFPYHVLYVDGNGSNFTKDTQYTSSRGNVITAKAGKGIADRAALVGMYEFLEKSTQYVTVDVDKNAPDIFNLLQQPEVTPTLTNGVITDLTIVSGGSGWASYNRTPQVVISPPLITTGTQATCKAEFTGGVLTAIKVDIPGSGYSSTNLPQIYVNNVHKETTTVLENDAYIPDEFEKFKKDIYDNIPGLDFQADDLAKLEATHMTQKEKTIVNDFDPSYKVKLDTNRNRVDKLPQRKYAKSKTQHLYEKTEVKHTLDSIKDIEELPNSYIDLMQKNQIDDNNAYRRKDIADITQETVPDVTVHRESYVETVQGTMSDLPYSSQYTKYLMRQYRPDTRSVIDINVTLSCTPVNAGCSHFACSAPAGSTGGTTDNGDGTSTTISYQMSGLLGDGCKAWTATGTMKMWNEYTNQRNTWKSAVTLNGNPYNP